MAIIWGRHIIGVVIILVVTYCCYSNSLYGDWAYDDQFAIVNNPDVTNPSSSPLLSFSSLSSLSPLLSHDFWGQDISKPDSHKSYRPATTLTFRLNYLLHGLDTYGYHLVNVFLHCVVSVMVYTLAHSIFGDSFISFLSGLLFGLHPIHTEGVSSIVGRSEPLCAAFYLSSLFSYRQARIGGQWWAHVLYITFYILATISKETGYTVLALMFMYSFLVVPFIPSASKRRRFDLLTATLLASGALFYIALRTWLTSTFILYNFRHLENPIAFAPDFLTRLLSFAYLHTQYLSLLILPINLSADYSFNAIPLVESLNDSRNVYSLLAYSSLAAFVLMTIYGTSRNKKNASKILWLLLFGIISFLPASNIFFYVGTMLAERLLYIPSIPFCILVAWASVRTVRALYSLNTKPLMRFFFLGMLVMSTSSLCSWYAWRTYVRNFDWKGEKELFMSALDVCPGSAKVWQSVGIIHRRSQNWTQAVAAFSKAQEIEPNYCEIDYWLGVTYLNMGKTDWALSKLHKSVTCVYTRVQAVEALNKVYDILISSSPNNTSYVVSWGNILETINQTHESASYYIQASIKLNKQGFSNQTIPLLEHAITLLYKNSPEPLSSVSPKDELACTAHMWLGAAYLSVNHTKAIENMRCIAGLATFLSPPILSPLSTNSNPILLKCPIFKTHGEQALASLYVSQLQSSGTLDARSRLELAVLLTAAGNTDSALYQYYEAASAISATGDFIGAQQVLSEALENTKKDKELKSYKQMEVLYKNLVTTIHKLKKNNEDESYIL